jgi:hypothetical protein
MSTVEDDVKEWIKKLLASFNLYDQNNHQKNLLGKLNLNLLV